MLNNVVAIYGRTQSKLPTAAPQQSGNTITLQQALATNANPAALRAAADWNERRVSSARHQAQAGALRKVVRQMERGQMQMGRAA